MYINIMIREEIVDDTYILYDIEELSDIILDDIKKEIKFESMYSQNIPVPRLVKIQGIFDNDYKPLYRHPIDTQPEITEMTPLTKKICDVLSKKLNQKFNHVLIQLYRSGNDFIGEHSDKTLDILKNTNIVNYSIGTTRTMRLRQKKINEKEREIKKIKLKNNSVFVLGWNTNQKWLHSIKQEKSLADLGERISFTFRTIATFIDDFGNIIGQGAPKNNFNTNDELDMLQAFSKENHEIDFDWNKYYGNGFNSINLKNI